MINSLNTIIIILSLGALLISCSRPCKGRTLKQTQPNTQKARQAPIVKTAQEGRQFGEPLIFSGVSVINPTMEARRHPIGDLTITASKKSLHVNVGDELNIVFTLHNKTDMCLITPAYPNEIQIDVLDENGKAYSYWPPPPVGWGRFGCPPPPGKEPDCTKFHRIGPGETKEYQRQEVFESSGVYTATVQVWNPIFLDTHTLKPTHVKAYVRTELTIHVSLDYLRIK